MKQWLLRRTRALLTLVVVAVVALMVGHYAASPNLEPPRNHFDEILLRPHIEAPQFLEVEVLLPSQAPAVHALVVMLEPELSSGFTDASGKVRIAHFQNGKIRLQAYLPQHDLLLIGPMDPESLQPLVLQEREIKALPLLTPQVLVRFDLKLVDQQNRPIADALLSVVEKPAQIATPTPTLAPWVSLADDGGWARVEGVPETDLLIRAYAPTLPLDPAWLLAQRSLIPRDEADVHWQIPVASIQFHGLAVGQLMYGERLQPAAKLPMVRVPTNGQVNYPVLPPGDYLFRIDDKEVIVHAVVGLNQASLD
ncbi:MAG: hypothetical protein H8E15_04045 [Planctomycetes bacterium]|nr:hypothetical protein [Planctomycetota bacterium]